MATILFVIADLKGHLNASLKMALDLRAEGNRVVYLGSEEIQGWVTQHGFSFERAPLPWLRSRSLAFQLIDLDVRQVLRWARESPAWVEQARHTTRIIDQDLRDIPAAVAEVVERLKPNLLVFDPFLLRYYIAFFPFRIPAVVLSTKPLFTEDPFVPPYTSWLIPGRSLPRRILVRFAWFRRRIRDLRDRVRLKYLGAITGYYHERVPEVLASVVDFPLREQVVRRPLRFDYSLRSVPELVLFPPEYDFPRKTIPPRVHYVGPCVHMERLDGTFPWEEIPTAHRIVYCSLGTVQRNASIAMAFFRRVTQALESMPGTVLILATGNADVVRDLRTGSSRVYVAESVPQLQVLSRAQVMITHGGSNSVRECILAGVPMLVYPSFADQPGNSARVVYHGLGLRGHIRDDLSQDIVGKLWALIHDPAYKQRLMVMRGHFIRANRTSITFAQLQSYAQEPTPPSRTAPASNGSRLSPVLVQSGES